MRMYRFVFFNISIHALREEGDSKEEAHFNSRNAFLSTPSARRATWRNGHNGSQHRISIHALREEGDAGHRRLGDGLRISIHALREEGDLICL